MKYTRDICKQNFLIANQFAKDVINSNYDMYSKRNQEDFIKIYNDIVLGKLCELEVSEELGTSYPDLKVYAKGDKTFDADLTMGEFKIHVKSCRKGSVFGESWVFQEEDRLVTEPSKNDVLALCIIDHKQVEFYTIKAKDAVYRDPIKKSLTKKVIYKEDI